MIDDLSVTLPCNLAPNKPVMTLSSGSSTTFCSGDTVTLNATGAHIYSWAGGKPTSTFVITTTNMAVVNVTGTDTISGCSTSASLSLKVNPAPNVVVSGNPMAACPGSTVLLTATGAASYLWFNGLSQSTIAVTPTTQTSYTVTGTANNGCFQSKTITISTYTVPVISAASDRSVICLGESVTLSGEGAQRFEWKQTDGWFTLGNPIVVTPTTTSTYISVGYNAYNCSSWLPVTVVVDNCNGVSERPLLKTPVLFPNPATAFVTFANVDQHAVILIRDLSGRTVQAGKISPGNNDISIRSLADGIYYISVVTGNQQFVLKLVKH